MKQPVKKRTKAQEAASRKWAAAGRAKESAVRAKYRAAHHGMGPPRSKAQRQATRKWQLSSVAAAAARRQGKKPAPRKQRAAVWSPEWEPRLIQEDRLPGWSWALGCNDVYPTCAAAAVANHLYASTGLQMAEHEIVQLHKMAGGDDNGANISDVLEYLASSAVSAGGRGFKLANFTRTDEDIIVAGLVVGLDLPHGSHAVLSHPEGMVSWGRIIPWRGMAGEAWALDWVW